MTMMVVWDGGWWFWMWAKLFSCVQMLAAIDLPTEDSALDGFDLPHFSFSLSSPAALFHDFAPLLFSSLHTHILLLPRPTHSEKLICLPTPFLFSRPQPFFTRPITTPFLLPPNWNPIL